MPPQKTAGILAVLAGLIFIAGTSLALPRSEQRPATTTGLTLRQDEQAGISAVSRAGGGRPFRARRGSADERPDLHPIVGPGGEGVLTDRSPSHHRGQAGL